MNERNVILILILYRLYSLLLYYVSEVLFLFLTRTFCLLDVRILY